MDGAVQPEEDDVRPRRPAPLHYALGILGTSKSKQTARSNSGNPRMPHLEAELSFTSFDIHSAPTARQGEVGYSREEPTAAARRCSVRENQLVVQFCYLTCHWKQSCRVWGLVFQVVFFPLLFLEGVGWQLTHPRGLLLTKHEALPGGEGGFYFIFFHLWFSPYISSLSFYILIYYFCIYLPYKRCMKVSRKQIKRS